MLNMWVMGWSSACMVNHLLRQEWGWAIVQGALAAFNLIMLFI